MAARGVCAPQCGGTSIVPRAAINRATCSGLPRPGRHAPRARLAQCLQRPLDRCLPRTRLRGCVAYWGVAALLPGVAPHGLTALRRLPPRPIKKNALPVELSAAELAELASGCQTLAALVRLPPPAVRLA